MADRPTPHSIAAIRSSRAGGKKAPKKYRKSDKNKIKKDKDAKAMGNIFSRALHHMINAIGRL